MDGATLDPNRGIGVREVAQLLGVSPSFIYKLTKADRSFPRGAKLGRAKRWIASDVTTWLAAKRRAK